MLDLLKSIYPYFRAYRKRAFFAVCLAIPLAAIKSLQATIVKPLFDKGLSPASSTEETAILALYLLALAVVSVPTRFFHFYWIRYAVDRASCDLREIVYRRLQKIPLNHFQQGKQGETLAKVISDIHTMVMGFQGLVDAAREPLVAVCMLALAFYRDWQLTLVIFTVSPLFLIIFQRAGKRIRGHQKAVQENLASMTHNVNEGIAAQKVSKAFNLEKFMIDRFKKSQDQYFRFQMKSTKVEELTSPLVEFVGAIAFAGVIVFAHHRIKMGAMTTGDFVSFFTALVFFMDPIRKISRANLKINQARAAADRVFEIMEVETEKNTGTRPIKEFKDKIEFRNITFSYGENTVLKNFSLTISKGEKVALVGLSGSGKSTLINLALRLYPLDSGEIYLDGYPIEEYELHELRSLFGLVSQDIFLFNDTILENLTLGNKALEVGVEQALEVAYAREFVEEMPAKLETVIGDRGMRLSGGQAQRITIARAFLQDSPVLLFDEATSALDNESEKVVQAALDKLAQDRTVLAVAHRLSTIQNFDKIVVLQSGKIMEEGHHRDLMQSNGEYRKLYELSSMP